MSLDWNASACKDSRAIGVGLKSADMTKTDKIAWAKTEHIIFASMLTGLDKKKWEITEEGAAELFARIRVLELTNVITPVRWLKHGEVEDCPITYADIVARIGLRTNVAPVTRNQFYIKVGQSLMDRARYEMPDDVRRTFKAWSR